MLGLICGQLFTYKTLAGCIYDPGLKNREGSESQSATLMNNGLRCNVMYMITLIRAKII